MRHSLYHKSLRVSGVLVGLVLLFDSGMLTSTTETLSLQTRQYIATAVGMYAAVEENELNALTGALSERQRALDAREAALREREIDAQAQDTSAAPLDISSYILSALLFLILVLIVLNYIFDWMRARKAALNYANTA